MSDLRVGIIACGKAGQAQMHWFSENRQSRIVGVYDPDEQKARDCAKAYDTELFGSWQELAAHPAVDLVSICSPESAHAEQAIYSCKQHKHTLCEKPFANTLDECDAMIQAAEDGGVLLVPYFNLRFHPVVDAINGLLPDLGDIYSCRINYTQFRTDVTWRHKLEQGGGVLKSQGVHTIDLMVGWLGPVATVSGEMMIVHPERDVEDFALLTMRLRSGAVGEIYVSYTDRQEEEIHGYLQGTRGKLSFAISPYDPKPNAVWLTTSNKKKALPLRATEAIDPIYPGLLDSSKRAIDHVVEQVMAGKVSSMTAAAARQSIEIVLAGYESQRRGEKVWLPLEDFDAGSLKGCFPHFDSLGDSASE
jgi:predicted dehydrogenase